MSDEETAQPLTGQPAPDNTAAARKLAVALIRGYVPPLAAVLAAINESVDLTGATAEDRHTLARKVRHLVKEATITLPGATAVTPTPLIDTQLADAEVLVGAATDGPWTVEETHGRDPADDGWSHIAIKAGDVTVAEMVSDGNDVWRSNADLIAASRTLIPALAAEVKRLQALTATCTCGTPGLDYDGPQADCPIHGAIRAYNEACAEVRRLQAELNHLTVAEQWRDGTAALGDLLADLWLHVRLHDWNQLTGEQKELFADAVDAAHERVSEASHPGMDLSPIERWWRTKPEDGAVMSDTPQPRYGTYMDPGQVPTSLAQPATDAGQPASPITAEMRAAIESAPIQFWRCPEDHPQEPLRVEVEWDGDVATCLDCGRTSTTGQTPLADKLDVEPTNPATTGD